LEVDSIVEMKQRWLTMASGGSRIDIDDTLTMAITVREVLQFPPLSHPNPTNPKCKKLKIDLLNKKIKTLRVGGIGVGWG
jgi:hypothetical protein